MGPRTKKLSKVLDKLFPDSEIHIEHMWGYRSHEYFSVSIYGPEKEIVAQASVADDMECFAMVETEWLPLNKDTALLLWEYATEEDLP